ncbi:MAG TPA: type III-A CRISPR-associated protein Cas10/Csm1, partial [Sutterella sp.]|nr:type III-A CRISPR-associated protein Cas10/Csm1 [Sutterella sp.]
MNQLEPSCLVAAAALVRELDSFAARAGVSGDRPAYEALDGLPEPVREFLGKAREDQFLQQILKAAGQVALGAPEGKGGCMPAEDKRLRLHSLFEQIRLPDADGKRRKSEKAKFGYGLAPMSGSAIFPKPLPQAESGGDSEAASQYRRLWDCLASAESGLGAIPASHRSNLPLWLDHFESLWLTCAWSIPLSQARSEISLYDYSRVAAAAAAALWRWHQETGRCGEADLEALASGKDAGEKKFLLIQGDFFGIQEFIFAQGSQTNKKSAKLLRGRSFYVSLVTELAALRLLEETGLPSTSIVLNAAGKFLIVAPNTDSVKSAVEKVRGLVDDWFIKNTLGLSGLGIVTQEASQSDFMEGGKHYANLLANLFRQQDLLKLHKFRLNRRETAKLAVDYSDGVDPYDRRQPNGAAVIADQIKLGELLTRENRILVLKSAEGLRDGISACRQPIFGYQVAFTDSQEASGAFGKLAQSGQMLRCWDFALPQTGDEVLFHGYARRNINGFVPRFDSDAEGRLGRFEGAEGDRGQGQIKAFEFLARQDRTDEGVGMVAIAAVKGDVDNLGLIFQHGLANPAENRHSSFAKTACLSRQLNAFFSVYLPALCEKHQMYTVFAGGDDFFLIGPWHSAQEFALELESEFVRYVSNPEVHFSAGIAATKPACPPPTLSHMA